MEIISNQMRYEEIVTPPTACIVCEGIFSPSDDSDFVCPNYKAKLHCGCSCEDVVMEWGVETEAEEPYFWIVECLCGRQIRSRQHSLEEIDTVAKEIFTEWMAQ